MESRPSNPQAVVSGEGLFCYSLMAAFVVLGVIGVLHHAMWRDEVYTWLMARFSNSLRDEYLVARYDPHFMLWHVVLWILTRFTHDCQSMQWLHLALATGGIWVLIRFSPFTRVQKALCCFGYFAIFEYCLVAREYVWIGLLLFTLCALCTWRRDSFVAQAVILFLLSNINALATIIAFSFVAAAALEHIRRRDIGELWATRNRTLVLSGVILCAALLGDTLQSIKPKDAVVFQDWPRPMTISSFAAALGDVWRGYVPIPKSFPRVATLAWGSNFLLDFTPQAQPLYATGLGMWVRPSFVKDSAPQTLVLGATLSLGLVVMSAWTLRRSPMAVAWYLFGTGLMVLFHFVVSEAFLRHDGLYFILYLACAWCALTWGRDPKPQSSPASLPVPTGHFFLPSILAIQVVAGAYAWTLHLRTPFSGGKQAADFIRQHGYANLPIVASKEVGVTPVTAYLDRPVYYPDSGRYGTFSFENSARHDLSVPELLQSVGQIAMKAHRDTLLVWTGWLMIPQDDGRVQPLRSAWLSPDGRIYLASGPATEQRMKISLLADFRTTIADEGYSLYLISKP